MARPRRGKRRRDQRDWITDFLLTGIRPDRDSDANAFEVINLCGNYGALEQAWKQRRERIMRAWNKPGLRPFAWWMFDAPRLPTGTFAGRFFDGTLPQPRKYLAGTGCPAHERLAVVPSQHFGIWRWFGDPKSPPAFESQFDYLARHGLLLPGEDEPLPEPHPHPDWIIDASIWENLEKKNDEHVGVRPAAHGLHPVP